MVEQKEKIPVTVMIFTLDEEVNLPYCLQSVSEFEEVVVVDSYSSDATEQIAKFAGAVFVQNTFKGFGVQRNWAFDNIQTRFPWILVMDADERVPPELAAEIRNRVMEAPDAGAFKVRRRFFMWGRWLRYSSLYPNWVVRLVHKERVRYENRGHSETQTVSGDTLELAHDLIDENHKGFDDWLQRQLRYAEKEAEYELGQDRGTLQIHDLFSRDALARRACLKRISHRMPVRAIIYFFYSYFFRLGFLDGVDGYRFVLMKSMYQHLIAIKKHEIKLKHSRPVGHKEDLHDN